MAAENRLLKLVGLSLCGLGAVAIGKVADDVARPTSMVLLSPWAWLIITVTGLNLIAAGWLTMAAGIGTVSPWVDRRRRQAVGLQFTLANVLALVFFLGLWLDDSPANERRGSAGWQFAFAGVTYLLAFVAWRVWRHSQHYTAPSAQESLARDLRKPVLYLRSFLDDGQLLPDSEYSGLENWFRSVLAVATPEQSCAAALHAVGPVVAIGKPGEPVPELGAARLYVGHEAWQSEVQALMDGAALVVLRIGSSPGLLWELEQALVRVPRQRLVLAVIGDVSMAPPVAALLEAVLGQTLHAASPPPTARANLARRLLRTQTSDRRLGALICFPVGVAHVVPIKRADKSPLSERLRAPVKVGLRQLFPLQHAWHQVFAELKLGVRVAHTKSRVVAFLLAIALGYVGAHWFYLGQRQRGMRYLWLLPLLGLSIFLAWLDALRFVWQDRAAFDDQHCSGKP